MQDPGDMCPNCAHSYYWYKDELAKLEAELATFKEKARLQLAIDRIRDTDYYVGIEVAGSPIAEELDRVIYRDISDAEWAEIVAELCETGRDIKDIVKEICSGEYNIDGVWFNPSVNKEVK